MLKDLKTYYYDHLPAFLQNIKQYTVPMLFKRYVLCLSKSVFTILNHGLFTKYIKLIGKYSVLHENTHLSCNICIIFNCRVAMYYKIITYDEVNISVVTTRELYCLLLSIEVYGWGPLGCANIT